MVEEIVGEILEGDEEAPVEFLEDNVAVVQGEVNIDEVNEMLGIDLPRARSSRRSPASCSTAPGASSRRARRSSSTRSGSDRARGQHPDHVRAGHRARRRGGGRRGRRGRRALESSGEPEAPPNDGVRVGRDQWESGEEFC